MSVALSLHLSIAQLCNSEPWALERREEGQYSCSLTLQGPALLPARCYALHMSDLLPIATSLILMAKLKLRGFALSPRVQCSSLLAV